jgi:ribosomal protein S18 acetylase RimI-like enzyme
MKKIDKFLLEVQDNDVTFESIPYKDSKDACNELFINNLKWTESRAKFPLRAKVDDDELSKILSLDKKFIKDSMAFFAKKEDENVGFVLATLDKQVKLGYIFGLYIKEGHRKKRIGAILFSKAKKWLKTVGAQEVEILIKGGNEGALSFYRSLGFRPRLYIMRMKGSKFSRKRYVSPHNRLK